MSAFLGCKTRCGRNGYATALVSLATVSTVFVVVFTAGCKKKTDNKSVLPASKKLETVYTNRMNDAGYVEALRSNRVAQSVQARERYELMKQVKCCKERVKATLAAGADEAEFKAALAKDPEWQKLDAQKVQIEGRIQATLNDARETIRKRMESEMQAVKAVSEGNAEAIDQPKVSN